MRLDELLAALPVHARVSGPADREIRALEIDSRAVADGALFVALRGEHTDGHRYIDDAVAAGAVAVVTEEPRALPPHVTGITVVDTARVLSSLADAFYGRPTRDVLTVGITGTNGKTTTSQMIAAVLNAAGIPAGVIGTIGARFREREWPLANTTPLAPQLQALFAQMRALGAKGAAMEVSSHALALHRVDDVRFRVGAFTNLTRDHLDFHKTLDAYAQAKHRLFEQAERCAFNAGDAHGAAWAAEFRGRKPTLTYALHTGADVRPYEIDARADGSTFRVDAQRFVVRIPGRFNVANALCAIAVARLFDITDAVTARGLESLARVPGRMDHLRGGGVDVIVDYSHTPDSLENALRALRETASQRVIAVFGCGGDRDRGKRPQMGRVASQYADYTYVTSDNPRTEDPNAIIAEILPGVGNAPHTVEPDRRRAIETAIAAARAGDVVLIAGKGHETYQIVGSLVLPFDDMAVARSALARRETVET